MPGGERVGQERVDPVAGAGAGPDDLHPRVDPLDVLPEGALVEAGRLGQVGLGDDDQMGGAERGGVLQRLVLALGHRHQHDPQVLAEVVGRRADEVADVLHEEHRGVRRQPALPPPAHLPCLQMAQSVGEQLLDRRTRPGEPDGVVLGREIGGEGSDRNSPFHCLGQDPAEEFRLAAAGAGQQVDHRHAPPRQVVAQARGQIVVLRQHGLFDVGPAHGRSSSES